MSIDAGEYFHDLASTFGNHPVPDSLSGEPLLLGDRDLRTPIHDVELDKVEERYEALRGDVAIHLMTASNFLRNVVAYKRLNFPTTDPTSAQPGEFINQLFNLAVPKGLITGRLRDYRLEAVATSDLSGPTLSSLEAQTSKRSLQYGDAYFLMTAEVFAGTVLGRIGKAIHLETLGNHRHNNQLTSIVMSPRLTSKRLLIDEAEVRSGARDARARGHKQEYLNRIRVYGGGSSSPR